MSAALIRANKLRSHDYIIMSRRFKRCSPINNRFTSLAVCTIFVSVFGGSGFFIEYCEILIMDMIRCRNSGEFCCNVYVATKRRRSLIDKIDFATNNFTVDIYNGLVNKSRRIEISVSNIAITIKCPHTHRNAYKSLVNSPCFRSIGHIGNYCQCSRHFIIVKFCRETTCNICTLCFPRDCIVKLEFCHKGINI